MMRPGPISCLGLLLVAGVLNCSFGKGSSGYNPDLMQIGEFSTPERGFHLASAPLELSLPERALPGKTRLSFGSVGRKSVPAPTSGGDQLDTFYFLTSYRHLLVAPLEVTVDLSEANVEGEELYVFTWDPHRDGTSLGGWEYLQSSVISGNRLHFALWRLSPIPHPLDAQGAYVPLVVAIVQKTRAIADCAAAAQYGDICALISDTLPGRLREAILDSDMSDRPGLGSLIFRSLQQAYRPSFFFSGQLADIPTFVPYAGGSELDVKPEFYLPEFSTVFSPLAKRASLPALSRISISATA